MSSFPLFLSTGQVGENEAHGSPIGRVEITPEAHARLCDIENTLQLGFVISRSLQSMPVIMEAHIIPVPWNPITPIKVKEVEKQKKTEEIIESKYNGDPISQLELP